MGIFDKIKEPVFLKGDSNAKKQLEELKTIMKSAPQEIKAKMEQDIRQLEAGIYGEEQVAFELKNSHMPMFVLHDLFLTDGELSAQIDYLIITRGHIFMIECKNLFGNIEINSSGDFIRTTVYNGKSNRECIYSPITQNRRHMELVKKIRGEAKNNFLSKALFDKFFYDTNRSVVVLANPKTVLNAKYAKKEVKEQVIRADQLIEYIRKVNSEKDSATFSEKDMEQIANIYLGLHRESARNYTEKYRRMLDEHQNKGKPDEPEAKAKEDGEKVPAPESRICPYCGAPMVKRTAKRGGNTGKEFWGCSKYPKCRGILNL